VAEGAAELQIPRPANVAKTLLLNYRFIKAHLKLRALVFPAVYQNNCLFFFKHGFGKRKPYSHTFTRCIFTMIKALKNMRHILFGNTAAVIFYENRIVYICAFGKNFKCSVFIRMLQTVFYNIAKALFRPVFIPFEHKIFGMIYQRNLL